ncbi:7-deoxyloganetin glucosyltransferase-like [Tasmannia lanceolata]|uniref:7-deoxyloganetin glucosyltransferase-like n=1 Tax=Tasmannia lanceolata TaxID=3420 RepID=UPI00406415A9
MLIAPFHKHTEMGSVGVEKPHVVLIPYPAQGHINPSLKLAKLLHFRGFYITFINTEFNHQRLLRSRGPDSLKGLDDFRFETIPDGLPPSDRNATQDIPALCDSVRKNCLVPFRNLITKLNNTTNVPPVTCIISDGVMSFTLDAADELQIPEFLFWTTSACGYLAYLHYAELIKRGLTPFKDESYFTNGYLNTSIDWIPGMKDIRLRDLPSFIRTTDPNDIMLDFLHKESRRSCRASGIILNTSDNLEHNVLNVLSSMLPPIYTVGPLSILCNEISDSRLKLIGSNLWKEEKECIEWLNTKEPKSVVYVNFGSITVMSPEQLREFAWGLANSKHTFLWITRPDIVMGDSPILPLEFVNETKERGLLASWCPQEEVLSHPSIGVFLTHAGWNSTLESIGGGVPVICWPFFAEQQTNCRFACTEWEIGMEIDNNVKREEVEGLVRELMEGEKGKEMKNKVMEWKEGANKATERGGSSWLNVEKLVKEIVRKKRTISIMEK